MPSPEISVLPLCSLIADQAEGASTDQISLPSSVNSTTFFSPNRPTIIVLFGVILTCLNCPWVLIELVGITISLSKVLVAVLNIKTLPGNPLSTISTLSLPIGWQEWVSVPSGQVYCQMIFFSGVIIPAPDIQAYTILPLESSVASSNSWMCPVAVLCGIEYCHTTLPSRTRNIDWAVGLRTSHSPTYKKGC